MNKCPVCRYDIPEDVSQCPACEFKGMLKWSLIKGATAYVQSTPHHQIEIDIIRNLKPSDTLYMREVCDGSQWLWELHANCPDYLESLDLRLTLYKDNPKAAILWDLYRVVDRFKGYWLSQLPHEYLLSRFFERLEMPTTLVDIPPEMPIKEAWELILNAYIKDYLVCLPHSKSLCTQS